MRRWHRDRNIMLRRWREEIAKHESDKYAYCSLAPIPPTNDGDSCHCYRGMGVLRKKTPYGCSNPHCTLCHYGKYDKKNRNNLRIKAIRDNLSGWGIV